MPNWLIANISQFDLNLDVNLDVKTNILGTIFCYISIMCFEIMTDN